VILVKGVGDMRNGGDKKIGKQRNETKWIQNKK
jgi:hypothetical protein